MKTMKCSQLGGPESCKVEFLSETFEDMAEQSKEHGIEMMNKKDIPHLEVMQKIGEMMKDPNAMEKWMTEREEEFNALPEDTV